jgi:hypothetical protein
VRFAPVGYRNYHCLLIHSKPGPAANLINSGNRAQRIIQDSRWFTPTPKFLLAIRSHDDSCILGHVKKDC